MGGHGQGRRTEEVLHQVGALLPEYRLVCHGGAGLHDDVGGLHHPPDLPDPVLLHEVRADLAADPVGAGGAVSVRVGALADGVPEALGSLTVSGDLHQSGGQGRGDHGAEAQVFGDILHAGVIFCNGVQLSLAKVPMLPYIPGGDVAQTQIKTPVGAEHGGLLVLGLLDPERLDLLPA